MSFGTESSTPVGGQTLTGFIVSKAMQSRKEAKKSDRKERKKKEKNKEDTSSIGGEEKRQGIGAKLLGGLASLPNLFAGKKPPVETPTKKQRSSGGATGLAKILSQGFGSLSLDNLQLSSALASITQLLNNSYKAQSFTATGVQTISAILSDQLENQSSILSTVKSLKPGGGSGGGKGMFGTSKSVGVGGETLTGYLANKFDLGGQIARLFGKGFDKVKNFGSKLLGRKGAQGATKVAAEGAEAAAKKKLAQEITQKGLSSKGAIIGGKYISMTAAEAAQTLASKAAPKATQGPLAKLGGMVGGKVNQIAGGVKGLGGRMMAPITSKVAGMTGGKVGGKTIARLIPGAQTVLGLGFAGKELMEGDIVGAGLALGSAIPGPIGWGFLAADVAREVAGPQMVDKAFGQAIGGQVGFTDQQIADREKNMSATQRAMTTFSPSFTGLSSGGMTTSMASGGIGRVMVGEAAGGSKGEAVIPLSSNAGKQMLNRGNSSADPGMQTSAGSTLAVVDQFIKGMGPLGAPVSQALGPDIQQLSSTFGMSQTLPNLRIGGGKFKEDGNAKKSRDKFLEDLISGSLKALDAKKKDKPETSPKNTPPPPAPANPNGPTAQSRTTGPGAATTAQRSGTTGTATSKGPGSDKPMDGKYESLEPQQGFVQGGRDQVHLEVPGFPDRFALFNRKDGKIKIFRKGIFKGGNAGIIDVPEKDISYAKDAQGVYTDARLRSAYNEIRANILNSGDNTLQRQAVGWGYLTAEDIQKWKSKQTKSKQARGGYIQSPNSVMPQAAPSMAPIGATNIANSQTNSVSIINIMGGSSGGGSIPVSSSSSSQDSSQYISDPFPKGLAGVLCTSPWSVV